MNTRFLPLLALALCGADFGKPDLSLVKDSLDGRWSVVGSSVDWVISGQKLEVFQAGQKVNYGLVIIDSSRNPPTIDVTFTKTRSAYLGIYRTDGNEFEIHEVYISPGGVRPARPNKFGGASITLKFKRVK